MKNYTTYFIKKLQEPDGPVENLYQKYSRRLSKKEVSEMSLDQMNTWQAQKDEAMAAKKSDMMSGNDIFGNGSKADNIATMGFAAGSAALDAVDNALMGDKNFGAQSAAIDGLADSAAQFASQFGPWGKCVCAGTKVITNDGVEKNIEDLCIEDGILGYQDSKIIQQKIESIFEPSYKECIQIETHGGNILKCSIDHPIYSATSGRANRINVGGSSYNRHRVKEYQFKEAQELKIGDFIAEAGEIPFFGNKHIKNAYLIGMLIGDGTYGYSQKKSPRLFTGDPDTWKYLEENHLGTVTKIHLPEEGKYAKEFREYSFKNFKQILKQHGIYGQTRINKRLPKDVFIWDKESCSKLLAGLIDTDGCVNSSKDGAIYFTQSNIDLINQVKSLLLRFGIHSTIQQTPPKDHYIKNRKFHSKEGYILRIKTKKSIINFYNNIRLNISYKQKALEELYNYKLSVNVKDNSLEFHNIFADKIKKIIPLGKQLVYNLEVSDSHTYLANNIVTHNTAAAAIKGLNFLSKAGGQTVQGFDVANVASGFGDIGHMDSKSSRTIPGLGGVFDKGKIDRQIQDRNEQAQMALKAANISDTIKYEQEARMNSVDDTIRNNEIALAGGIDTSLLAAKRGAKLKRLQDQVKSAGKTVTDEEGNIVKVPFNIDEDQKAGRKPIYYKKKAYYLAGDSKTCLSKEYVDKRTKITKAQNGAKIEMIETSETPNILPTGALHKNLNHTDLANTTPKGISVITIDDDNVTTFEEIKEQEDSIVQHCEIEALEIIFNKEVTDYIEENRKKWHESNDENILLEVGKRITKEILANTIDKDNLIAKEEAKL